MFNGFEYPTSNLIDVFEVMMMMVANKYNITYKNPPHDIARRLLNEVVEFKPKEE